MPPKKTPQGSVPDMLRLSEMMQGAVKDLRSLVADLTRRVDKLEATTPTHQVLDEYRQHQKLAVVLDGSSSVSYYFGDNLNRQIECLRPTCEVYAQQSGFGLTFELYLMGERHVFLLGTAVAGTPLTVSKPSNYAAGMDDAEVYQDILRLTNRHEHVLVVTDVPSPISEKLLYSPPPHTSVLALSMDALLKLGER